MILKTNTHQPSISSVHRIKTLIENVKERIGGSNFPNIYILDGDFTNEEMNSYIIIHKLKLMYHLLMVKGLEGPLLEACVSGKPIIASAEWSLRFLT